MNIISNTYIRNLFNLNISSSELKKIDKLGVVKISNSTVSRLERTLSSSKNAEKKQKIQLILEEVSIYKNAGNDAIHHDKIRMEKSKLNSLKVVSTALHKYNSQQQEKQNASVASESQASAQNKKIRPTPNAKEKALERFLALGLNLSSIPKNMEELSCIVNSCYDQTSAKKFNNILKKIGKEKKFTLKLASIAMKTMLRTPSGVKKFAQHFNGSLSHEYCQSTDTLSNIQIGKEGLCGVIAYKWAGDKIQNISFFDDIKTPDGLDEILTMKIGGEFLMDDYLRIRGFNPYTVSNELNLGANDIGIIRLTPSLDEPGHVVATYTDGEKKSYHFFDSNYGEFTFSTLDDLSNFTQEFNTVAYPDLSFTTLISHPLKRSVPEHGEYSIRS